MVSLIPKVIQLEASTRDEAFKVEELLEGDLGYASLAPGIESEITNSTTS